MQAVPFYANTPDDTHCFQAAMKMILGFFMPEREFSWVDLEKLSAKAEGMSTWPQQMLLSLVDLGFEVVDIGNFDAQAFIAEGADYLYRTYDQETADWQVKWSDIPQEQAIFKKVLKSPDIHTEDRVATWTDLQKYLHEDYLVTCNINSQKLNNKSGYIGHSVVVYDIDDNSITLHDPGPPPIEGRKVSRADFEAAWAYPNEDATNVIAIKPKGKS